MCYNGPWGRPFYGSEPQNFECFASKEVDVKDNRA